MTESQAQKVPSLPRLLEAPILYFDSVPSAGKRGPIVAVQLASYVSEPATATTKSRDNLVAVAHLRFPLATAAALRDVLDKILLAAAPTSGGAN